ncbi:Por secretion system C-terminal sorting domain-containing protein [Lutibacter agarilyticus]|uniref:Por secretion system C-terminal sorting domain-containing protein n=1 Tax=Lutibacter agarilyticus TaxID=1109740 RepID=A0A238YJS7_9FLAO|nr:T9SS type A sorting domain-containing protein [Lutibacter agarilyticus]SNR70883.1 Por secretion system C-terminal sorting domain-containing protein [Lutibacter agarilyticus]
MKTKLHKTLLFLLVTVFALQVQGQAFVTGTLGTYKIKVQGTNLYLTQSTTTDAVTYETEVIGSDTQLFIINDHPDLEYYSITSKIVGKGALETLSIDTDKPALGCKGNLAGGVGQQDKWNLTRGVGTQIFLESDPTDTGWDGKSKRRFQDYAEGAPALLNGGTAVAFDWIFVEGLTLSNEEFDTSAFFMSNLVNDQLTIQGLPSNVKQIAVYSLLGQKLITKEVSSESLNMNVSSLKTGMYIVDFIGENGRFTKKIIKQ